MATRKPKKPTVKKSTPKPPAPFIEPSVSEHDRAQPIDDNQIYERATRAMGRGKFKGFNKILCAAAGIKTTTVPAAPIQISPENKEALALSLGSHISNVSSECIEENKPFDTGAYDLNYQALALMEPHLLLVPGMGMVQKEFKPLVDALAKVEMPDTKVKIRGQVITIPWRVKQGASELRQDAYTKAIHALLSGVFYCPPEAGGPPEATKRMFALQGIIAKANMLASPALWLNQEIWIETQRRDVARLIERAKEISDRGDGDTEQTTSWLRGACGRTLFVELEDLATSHKVATKALFVTIIEAIIQQKTEASKPIPAASIWEGATRTATVTAGIQSLAEKHPKKSGPPRKPRNTK
jgi:hypothetical protein